MDPKFLFLLFLLSFAFSISSYFPINQNAEQGFLTIFEPITKNKTIGENAH